MNANLGLILDVAILVALGVTIWHAQHLSKQFNRMQADRAAFEQLISALNVAASRAEAAIAAFKETAATTGDSLQERINAGRTLADELEIMVQAGDNLAERLQALAEQSGKTAAARSTAPQAGPRFGAMEDTAPAAPETNPAALLADDRTRNPIQPRTRAEKELLEALKAKQNT